MVFLNMLADPYIFLTFTLALQIAPATQPVHQIVNRSILQLLSCR